MKVFIFAFLAVVLFPLNAGYAYTGDIKVTVTNNSDETQHIECAIIPSFTTAFYPLELAKGRSGSWDFRDTPLDNSLFKKGTCSWGNKKFFLFSPHKQSATIDIPKYNPAGHTKLLWEIEILKGGKKLNFQKIKVLK
jgi:hypothetical protein